MYLFDKEMSVVVNHVKLFIFECRMSASEVTSEAAAVVHIQVSDRPSTEEVTASLDDYAAERKKSLQARYYFGIIFLIMNLVAWFFRDYGQSLLLPWVHCKSIYYALPKNRFSHISKI